MFLWWKEVPPVLYVVAERPFCYNKQIKGKGRSKP